jgi:hypothetical protein
LQTKQCLYNYVAKNNRFYQVLSNAAVLRTDAANDVTALGG